MTAPGEVLAHHTLVVRDGRILAVLPHAVALERYTATVNVERTSHLVLPGLVNAGVQVAVAGGSIDRPERRQDAALMSIAELLKGGTTCFGGAGFFPEETAHAATEQGLRALIGLPIAAAASSWADGPGAYLTRALQFRDVYLGHPTITTAFAPHSPCTLSDEAFRRIATLADELDTGVVVALHESAAEVEQSLMRHGARPIARLDALGLLTPALTAMHMAHVDERDIDVARRAGIALVLCPDADVLRGHGLPPVAAWIATGLRIGLGSGRAPCAAGLDSWSTLRLTAVLSAADDDGGGTAQLAWEALARATRGGAAALGLGAEIGTLETGKWADLCCVDLRGPAMQRGALGAAPDARAICAAGAPLVELAFNGGRELVSDVWVAGRHLLNEGAFTRLDWGAVRARVTAWDSRSTTGDAS
jgi:5-methylthioadenosine/S-adenosylhomocysteine deaminase